MKRQNETRRSGVVLLLILGLMAMFAISVLSYMVVTSNMAETAQNSQKLDSVVKVPAENDIDAAMRNLLIGSNNVANPIAPFSILENMYGNWSAYDSVTKTMNTATTFTARIAIFPHLGYAVLTPKTDFFGVNHLSNESNDYETRLFFSGLFEGSGNVMTFMDLDFTTADEDAYALWNANVVNTSTYVAEKVITDPSSASYNGNYWLNHYYDSSTENENNEIFYSDFNYWHFKVELSDDLKKFVDEYFASDSAKGDFNSFNRSEPVVTVRMNRPAYSGTGAGGFAPGSYHDSTFDPDMISSVSDVAWLRLPFALWMNAAAPDMWPYYLDNSSPLSFRSYWAHLADVGYDPTLLNGSAFYYGGWNGSNFNFDKSVYDSYYGVPDSVRMNPAYTAPDARTPFLAHYKFDEDGSNESLPNPYNLIPYESVVPSFHRPDAFRTMSQGAFLGMYRDAYNALGISDYDRQDAYLYALLRKLTPRPLPLDHWNFTGSNPDSRFCFYVNPTAGGAGMTPESFAQTLGGLDGSGNVDNTLQWDVDNDNDGFREGVWIPSGLPIRYDKNGTPYATMFSYTVLDLDGRVNVNVAGNWDQLYSDSLPYNYVGELADVLNGVGSVSAGSPFYVSENLNDKFGWLDDLGQGTNIAERGEGRGASNVLLYEALAAAFDSYNNDIVRTVASNLLWRRNQEQYKAEMTRVVDTSALNWGVGGLSMNGEDAPQPGCFFNGTESDDSSNTRAELFRFLDPIWLNEPTNPGVEKIGEVEMVFPWRGKTTVDMNQGASVTPAFDFADTAFRSYDPLGQQIYSYAPRFSNNPYLAYQNARSWQDNPYSLPMLERLLRPSDSDSTMLPSQLVDDLRMNSDLYLNATSASDPEEVVRNSTRERAKARMTFTTVSSDVPAASLVFPENFEDSDGTRYGNYGFVDLVRRNVRSELRRVFEVKGICRKSQDENGNFVEGTNKLLDSEPNRTVFERKVDEITAYLVSMLPKEILAGEKIDLNALSQKNYWLDVDSYIDNNVEKFVKADFELHNEGLVKRMEYARGLYLVVMTLLYEDMNARRLYDPNNELVEEYTDEEGNPQQDYSATLSDYIEGSFDLLTFKDDEKKKDLIGRELMAARIAQWCVNVVDFSDPDATMTPFFFDPTPFDGWWVDWEKEVYRTQNGAYFWNKTSWLDGVIDGVSAEDRWNTNNWDNVADPETPFLFPSFKGLPSEQMYAFFLEALNKSDSYTLATSENKSVYLDRELFQNGYIEKGDDNTPKYSWLHSNELIAKWASKKIRKLEDQTTDLGFRLVWGMERPDLVLTETLNFHDLGIADTELEVDGPEGVGNGRSVGRGDPTFDQVRRPEGSSYLELYCTANPNVPQSRELYEYDASLNGGNGGWKLQLSKTTPIFTDQDSAGGSRELEFPVWRVAISDSADPSGLNSLEGQTPTKKEEIRKRSDSVYHKSRNSVLEWLTPHKDGNKYDDDISFFSMQPRQFRNAPLPENSTDVSDIASLDLDQGTTNGGAAEEPIKPKAEYVLSHWMDYNLLASNVLGSAVAATYDDSRLREVEIDRILWFTHAQGDGGNTNDGTALGTAGAYPDALRTFCNAAEENVYLKPNQYLVVGPEERRSIGSAVAISTTKEEQQFGQDPDPAAYPNSFIDITRFNLPNVETIPDDQRYKYMAARANIGGRGFNISEPLWTANKVDPYYANQDDDKKIDNSAGFYPGATDLSAPDKGVRDIPFEVPKDWANRADSDEFYDNQVANYPIVKDEIFGLGTIPAYKTAFVQRVADPNRPYHPVMNPYITVDWNMMDLTVFTGEVVGEVVGETFKEQIDDINKRPFASGGEESYPFSGNKIELARNVSLGLNDADKTIEFKDAFSSRQWGSQEQKMFAPGLYSGRRPNLWTRAFKVEGDKGGLEEPSTVADGGDAGKPPAMPYVPRHTLGFYNDHGKWGQWADVTDAEGTSRQFLVNGVTESGKTATNFGPQQYKNLNPVYMEATGSLAPYRFAPQLPFEHLIWNDAPFSNPYELMAVPASSPGRFGLEFHRHSNKGMNLQSLYEVDNEKKGALGSFGFYGFDDWYTNDNIKQEKNGAVYEEDNELKKLMDKKVGFVGPYLNFFASSKKVGDTLNLANLLELVRTPSYFLGARKLAGFDLNNNLIADEFGNATIYSSHRDPGKVNINTLSKPVWNALVNTTDRVPDNDRLPGTPWEEFQNSRYPFETKDSDGDGETDYVADLPYAYFQPSYTTPMWIQIDGSSAPIGSYSTLLAQQALDTNDEDSVREEPLFDNLFQRYVLDGDGNVTYSYSYKVSETGEPASGTGVTLDDIDQLKVDEENGIIEDLKYDKVITARRGNLFDATAEMQRLSGVTTTRSNVFAVWATVGYFEAERCRPGVNMPSVDPEGNTLTSERLTNPTDKWYHYYQAIYPDGYTYGKELGADYGETQRHRGFSVIDRSIPVDFRRGNSVNYHDAILMKRVIE